MGVTSAWMMDRPGQVAPELTSDPNRGASMLIEFRHPNRKGGAADGGGTDLISVLEAARRIGLHADTLYRLCRTGRFSPAIQIGSRWRVSVPKLERYLHEGDDPA
jgi:excisionase family DNA binding protein